MWVSFQSELPFLQPSNSCRSFVIFGIEFIIKYFIIVVILCFCCFVVVIIIQYYSIIIIVVTIWGRRKRWDL